MPITKCTVIFELVNGIMIMTTNLIIQTLKSIILHSKYSKQSIGITYKKFKKSVSELKHILKVHFLNRKMNFLPGLVVFWTRSKNMYIFELVNKQCDMDWIDTDKYQFNHMLRYK